MHGIAGARGNDISLVRFMCVRGGLPSSRNQVVTLQNAASLFYWGGSWKICSYKAQIIIQKLSRMFKMLSLEKFWVQDV